MHCASLTKFHDDKQKFWTSSQWQTVNETVKAEHDAFSCAIPPFCFLASQLLRVSICLISTVFSVSTSLYLIIFTICKTYFMFGQAFMHHVGM